MLPKVDVKDRSTEELDGMNLLRCLQEGSKIQVREHYVIHRQDIGVPYDPPDGNVDPNPDFGPKDFVVVCVGGNDFALRGEMNPTVIIGFARQIMQFYKSRGVRPERLMYMST